MQRAQDPKRRPPPASGRAGPRTWTFPPHWSVLTAAVGLVLQACLVDFGEDSDQPDASFQDVAADHEVQARDAEPDVPTGAVCGNGIAEGDEVCDGSDLRGETCESLGLGGGHLACAEDCSDVDPSGCENPPTCGNGVVDPGEECDDGNHDNSDACPDGQGGTCEPATCGDGFVWAGHEECDDGNGRSGDGCSADCRLESCGNGIVDVGEECDSGGQDTATCDFDCTRPSCGDGHVNGAAGEQCDDGNSNNTDNCPDGPGGTCEPARCGDGFVWTGHEQCDTGGGDSPSCDADCTRVTCGDGHVNTAAGEACDDGDHDNTDDCPDGLGGTCQPAACGDAFVWAGHEDCDDGGVDTATCDFDCTTAECGDGYVNTAAGEACDDGDHDNTDSCPDGPGGTCQPATCGDAFVWAGHEDCDDGGVDTATCDSDCTTTECGDDYVNPVAGEECELGDVETTTEGCPQGSFKERSCQSDCTWSPWSYCMT